MNLFFLMIAVGGMLARPERKIGFFGRVFWPLNLGAVLHDMALDYMAARTAPGDDEVIQ